MHLTPGTDGQTRQAGARERWYQHGWVWFLFGLPAIVVVASFATLWIAIENPQATVRDDYYRHGLELNRRIDRAEAARRLGLVAELELLPDGGIEVSISPERGLPATLELLLTHPTDNRLDSRARLAELDPGHYVGQLDAATAGKRYVHLGEPGPDSAWALRGTLAGTRATLLPAAD